MLVRDPFDIPPYLIKRFGWVIGGLLTAAVIALSLAPVILVLWLRS